MQHVKIYIPYNCEVNPITHFGVISLFSSNFQNFNTFRLELFPFFQQIFKILILFVLYFKNYKR